MTFAIESAVPTKGVVLNFSIDGSPTQRSIFYLVRGPNSAIVDAGEWIVPAGAASTAFQATLYDSGPEYAQAGNYTINCFMSVDDPSKPSPFCSFTFSHQP